MAKTSSTASDAYQQAVTQYNSAFAVMNDHGLRLLRERERSLDVISWVEHLINSIAHSSKTFEAEIAEITAHREHFLAAEEFTRHDLEAAKNSALGAGTGLAAGAAVASVAPSAAMWVATTFGVASTGTAISTLSGAAASNAALAWLGGGALAAGGGGTVAGSALLALSGPIGWTIAGATVLTTITVYSRKRTKNRAAKNEALHTIMANTAEVSDISSRLEHLLSKTNRLREQLSALYAQSLMYFQADFTALAEPDRQHLATLVNITGSTAALLGERIEPTREQA